MNTAIALRASRATPSRIGKHEPRWKVRSFLVLRRDARDVSPYRSVVLTPFEESADLGVGLSPDEIARRVSPSFVDGLGASRNVRAEEIGDFWENLAVTIKSGGTESVALARATRMTSTPRMRGVLGAVRWRLNQGRSLHEALAEFPQVFGRAHCALAEAATQLPPDQRATLYLSLAQTLRDQASRGRRFVSTMLDQIITALMLVVLVFVTLLYFVPSFASMFTGLGLDLPWPYRVSMTAHEWLVKHGLLVVPTVCVAAFLLGMAMRRFFRSRSGQRFTAGLWGLGPLLRNLALSRSLPLFAVLHKAGVHPEMVFRLAGEVSGNAVVEDFFAAAYMRCASGMDMEKAFLSERRRLGLEEGRRLAGKIEAGGETGDLEGVLKGLASEFSERANAKIDALPKVIKPLNLAVMGVVVGLMAALVGLPSMMVLEKTLKQQNEQSSPRPHQN